MVRAAGVNRVGAFFDRFWMDDRQENVAQAVKVFVSVAFLMYCLEITEQR